MIRRFLPGLFPALAAGLMASCHPAYAFAIVLTD